jgi:hypothetical protein
MKILKIVAGLILVLLPVVIVLAPIGPLPGVFIGGTEAALPEQWPETKSVDEIRLKVPGTLPRVVIIWVIQYEQDLYVVGNSTSGWVQMLGEGGPVDMRLEGSTYALKAERLSSDWEQVLQAYVDKYRADYPDIVSGFPSIDEAGGIISVFKLSR